MGRESFKLRQRLGQRCREINTAGISEKYQLVERKRERERERERDHWGNLHTSGTSIPAWMWSAGSAAHCCPSVAVPAGTGQMPWGDWSSFESDFTRKAAWPSRLASAQRGFKVKILYDMAMARIVMQPLVFKHPLFFGVTILNHINIGQVLSWIYEY